MKFNDLVVLDKNLNIFSFKLGKLLKIALFEIELGLFSDQLVKVKTNKSRKFPASVYPYSQFFAFKGERYL